MRISSVDIGHQIDRGGRPWGEWEEPAGRPAPGWFAIWIGGVVAPILIGLYGGGCILSQEVTMIGQRVTVMFYGGNAIAIGIGMIALAGLLHCQLYWDSLYDSTRLGAGSKFFCLLVMGACSYCLCFRMGLFGYGR